MINEGDESRLFEIGKAKGTELISLFAMADVVEIGDHQFPVTNAGAAYFERDKATMSEIAAAISISAQISSEA